MSAITLSHPSGIINGTISLPASKSISNRALLTKAVTKADTELLNISEADDTIIMQQALTIDKGKMNIKNAGTCMRFLTAYFAALPNSNIQLLCDERMEKRPIHLLVKALRQLGADIQYLKKEEFPPLSIHGQKLSGTTIDIEANTSSQYISAIMMIVPLMENDVTIHLTGTIASAPYIEMTASVMQQFGIDVSISLPQIQVKHKSTSTPPSSFTIESDWSAASYWYQMVALSKDANIVLQGLRLKSIQGDVAIAELMKHFGVKTTEVKDGIRLQKIAPTQQKFPIEINLLHQPDLAPALAATASATNTPTILTHLDNLSIKESNRLLALATELKRCGYKVEATEKSIQIHASTTKNSSEHKILMHVYNDHRMAMAFAPLALVHQQIRIDEPNAVQKSYPHFWRDLKQVGFVIDYIA